MVGRLDNNRLNLYVVAITINPCSKKGQIYGLLRQGKIRKKEGDNISQSINLRPISHDFCIFLYGDGVTEGSSDRRGQMAVPSNYNLVGVVAITSNDDDEKAI